MQLDGRTNNILKEIINNPNIKSKDLENKYLLTRRQVGYCVNKINKWLEDKDLPIIERDRQGFFLLDPILLSTFAKEDVTEIQSSRVYTEEERVDIILLMLLSSNEELSLLHFTSSLNVSKNTVLNDLKQAQAIVAEDNLKISYSRRDGYQIKGGEFHIRRLLINVTYKLINVNGTNAIRDIAGISKEELNVLKKRIEKVENKLNLKFTDEKLESMPYILSLLLKRIKIGKKVGYINIDYSELSDTKEWIATEELLYDLEGIPTEERLFITLHLLTANVYWSEFLEEDIIPNLMNAIDEMLSTFERYACVVIQDKRHLLNKLLLHVKPAYYRIKYNLTEANDIQNTVSKEFKELHHLVKKSTSPLSELIGSEIPESETTYLTMLIGGWLTRQGEDLQEKIKAIVVCPKGVSVSRLMLSSLKELFPEFIFLDSLSVREFTKYRLDYDIIFSPMQLDTDKKLFIANSFLEKEEKYRLRKQVMMELHGYATEEINIDELIGVIEKNATVNDKEKLAKALYKFITQAYDTPVRVPEEDLTPSLFELIDQSNMTLRKNVTSWEEAIRVAAKPLIQKENITDQYLEAVIDHCKEDPYIIIGPGIAIPHASPEDGVKDVSMSLLRLEEGVEFARDHYIQVIIVIAALDKHQHLKALMQLMQLAGNKNDLELIKRSKLKKDISTILKKYVED